MDCFSIGDVARLAQARVFLEEANEAGLGGLKGHRSVGGIRASLYNGCPIESVEALVDFMRRFESIHG